MSHGEDNTSHGEDNMSHGHLAQIILIYTQKQIDLIMTTILKNTDKIYEENPDDNYRANCTNRLSYIRVVRMFTTTVDFRDKHNDKTKERHKLQESKPH
jgi:nitrous oxidase accessory protein NosD